MELLAAVVAIAAGAVWVVEHRRAARRARLIERVEFGLPYCGRGAGRP